MFYLLLLSGCGAHFDVNSCTSRDRKKVCDLKLTEHEDRMGKYRNALKFYAGDLQEIQPTIGRPRREDNGKMDINEINVNVRGWIAFLSGGARKIQLCTGHLIQFLWLNLKDINLTGDEAIMEQGRSALKI